MTTLAVLFSVSAVYSFVFTILLNVANDRLEELFRPEIYQILSFLVFNNSNDYTMLSVCSMTCSTLRSVYWVPV
jgi:hypothetical protein